MQRAQADAFIRRVTWLAETPVAFQDRLLAKCDVLRLQKAETLYSVGDAATGLYGVVEGYVEVHIPERGVESTLSYVGGPGCWLGDIAAVTGQPRRVSIVGRSACRLLRLPRAEVVRMTDSDPLAWRYFLLLLARNYARTVRVVYALKQADPLRRVAAMLLVLLEDNPPGAMEAQASQSDIAELANLGRTKVNASLKALERRGMIRRGYASIEVTDSQALQALFATG
jgi:CRP/FNR family transcriptional regulator, cyclic AMP receptor protein